MLKLIFLCLKVLVVGRIDFNERLLPYSALFLTCFRPQDKSAYWKFFFYFSTKTYVVGTQKNRLNETVLLSTQNTCLN